METGKVKFFNSTKGFGFIVDDKTKKDVFVHASGLTDEIRQDDNVTYEIKEEKKGPSAVNVRISD